MLQEHWANLNGLKIRYLESGKNNDRHILFIHGLGSSADRWGTIPKSLSANFHTISLDLPGFGESDKPISMDYTINFFRDIVIDFMNLLAINDQTSIVGHSLGGYIASEVIMQNKTTVERLVLIDSSGFLTKSTPLLEKYLSVAMNPTNANVRNIFEQMVSDGTKIPLKLVESFIKRINLPNAKYAFKSTLENSTNTQIKFDNLKLMGSVPTLIIWGVEDRVIPLQHSELFKKSISNSHIEIIQDAGHAPFTEKPEQVSVLIRNFLA